MKKDDVVRHFGSNLAVARALKISGAAISKWGDEIPEKQAYRIERMTQGKLKVGNEYNEFYLNSGNSKTE